MSSDVIVSFGGDTSDFNKKSAEAAAILAAAHQKMGSSASAAIPEIKKLQDQIDQLNAAAERSAKASESLESYAFWGMIGKVLSVTLEAVRANLDLTSKSIQGFGALTLGAMNLTSEGLHKVGDSVIYAGAQVPSLISQFTTYALTQQYLADTSRIFRIENDTLVGRIGQLISAYNEVGTRSALVANGLVLQTTLAAGAAGQYTRLAEEARKAGGTISQYYASMEAGLMKRYGMSDKDAAGVMSIAAGTTGADMLAQQAISELSVKLTNTTEDAKKLETSLSSAFSSPAAGGNSFLDSLGGITTALREQFDSEQRNNDVIGMRATLIDAMTEKLRLQGSIETQNVRDIEAKNKKIIEQRGLLGELFMQEKGAAEEELKAAQKKEADLREQVRLNELIALKMREGTLSAQETASAARQLVSAMNPLEYQLEQSIAKTKLLADSMSDAAKAAAGITVGPAGGGGGGEGSVGGFWTPENIKHAVDRLINEAGASPMGASGIVARWTQEAAEGPTAVNPKSGAQGIHQGLGDRAPAGFSRQSFDEQLSYIINTDMKKPNQAAAVSLMKTAQTPEQGSLAGSRFERAEGYNDTTGRDILTDKTPTSKVAAIASGGEEATVRAYRETLDATQRTRDALAGGDAVARAQAEILARNAAGQKDSLRDAQQMVAAWKEKLAVTNSDAAKIAVLNGLHAATVQLSERRYAIESADLSLRSGSEESAQKKLEIARSQYAIAMQHAGGDPAAQDAAKAALKQAEVAAEREIFSIAVARNAHDAAGLTTAREKYESAVKLRDIELKNADGNEAAKLQALTKFAAAEDAYEKDKIARKREAIEQAYALEMEGVQRSRSLLTQGLNDKTLNSQSKLDRDIELNARETAIKVAHERALVDLTDAGTVERIKAENKVTLATEAGATQRQQIITQDLKRIQQEYTHTFEGIGSGVSSSIMGMIKGQETLQQASYKVAENILSRFVSMGVKMVADWAAQRAMDVSQHIASEATKTGATAAGNATRLGLTASGAAAGVAAEKAANVATISGDAAKAGAGAYASVVQIPILGPVLAPAAAAAAFGAVEAFGSFDQGAWSIPHDQLAMVHKNELVMPAAESGAFRSMLSERVQKGGGSGSSGDNHVHFNVSAVDHGSVRQWFGDNSRHILEAINHGIGRGDHTGLRNLAKM